VIGKMFGRKLRSDSKSWGEMHIGRELSFETWTPNFESSGQKSPSWTRVLCEGEELINALGWINWDEDPTQLLICTACGVSGCEIGGYVHVSRIGEFLAFTPPPSLLQGGGAMISPEPHAFLLRHGAVLFPLNTWESIRQGQPRMPAGTAFPEMRRADLAELWSSTLPDVEERLAADRLLETLKEVLICSDDRDAGGALADLSTLISWVRSSPEAPVKGTLCAPNESGFNVVSVYLDGSPIRTWQAIARNVKTSFALDGELVFVPELTEGHGC